MPTLWSINSQKISKIGAARCLILRLKSTKLDFRWGSAPDPAGGAYSANPDPLAVFKGPTSKRRKEERGEEGKGRKRETEGRDGGERRGGLAPQLGSLDPPVTTIRYLKRRSQFFKWQYCIHCTALRS